MVKISMRTINTIAEATKDNASCWLVPYHMDIDNNGFDQSLPPSLEPVQLNEKQSHELMQSIRRNIDSVFSCSLHNFVDGAGICSSGEVTALKLPKNYHYSFIEFTLTTFYFYLVNHGLKEYHSLMNQWKASKTDLVSVCIQHQKTDEEQ